ncbi:MAG: hypothetical protein JRH08_02070 [Deltaproteobacteria bacterium]|nr:hypothetical protein [Deltaproteobacteria bacterium]MBW1928306.1 hypothetical protein [Deltaproteobacteria bacterium]MBW2025021.1 hypothetical protein [Deltaproteobacteria bacterium]MBW2124485.1 hypothetical protein [Deltaproteobacteria bacterium]RLB17957.1 MAG: hypothetical protein DRG63_03070 [Deltaproteobacteria bacterium]
MMDEGEYKRKYANLRILKSVQEYLKDDTKAPTAVYPINVPDDLLYQILQHQGPEKADEVIHRIFKIGLTIWSEQLYKEAFGSEESLKAFIDLVKKKNKE